ncbi:MAG: pyridoxal-phosphate dependent enzyme [Deltaproteobacteria bacterium]|nr:pyridoxal-phosphate dependent enzyme [Deltaproteobacteria bacterium]
MISDILRKKKVYHKCVGCGKEFPHNFLPFCDCGHFIDIQYDLKTVKFNDSSNPYHRYFDLLPIENPDNLISVDHKISPTHHSKNLGKKLGLPNLYLKDETVFPTKTTKDRMAAIALSYLKEVGIKEFCTSSTGNSSSAMAHYIKSFPDLRVYLFAAEDFLDRLNFEENDQIVVFVCKGATFVEAFAEAGKFAVRKGLTSERGFFNPARREGLKTAFLEAAESVPKPIDWYVQAVSSAMGVYGVYKGAKELMKTGKIKRLPRLLCVQQQTNNPMVRAFEAGSEVIRPQDIIKKPYGIAPAILRGDPSRVYPYIRKIVLESNGSIKAVTEQEIRDARKLVEDLEGLTPCFTASVATAGMIRMIKEGLISKKETILVNLTGGDRPDSAPLKNVHWLERSDKGWKLADKNDLTGQELWEN